MRFWIRLLLAIAICVGLGWAAKKPIAAFLKQRNWPQYRQEQLSQGTIRSTVSTTGKIEPILKVLCKVLVSGPIIELSADFNSAVQKDERLGRIDRRLYGAGV